MTEQEDKLREFGARLKAIIALSTSSTSLVEEALRVLRTGYDRVEAMSVLDWLSGDRGGGDVITQLTNMIVQINQLQEEIELTKTGEGNSLVRKLYEDAEKQSQELKDKLQGVVSDAVKTGYELEGPAKALITDISGLEAAYRTNQLTEQPPKFAEMSEQEKNFLRIHRSELYEGLSKLPPPSGKTPNTKGSTTASKTGGTDGAGGSSTAASAAAPPPPVIKSIGTFNGLPVYGPDDYTKLQGDAAKDGYRLEIGANQLSITALPGEGNEKGSQSFTLDALKGGAVDLKQFAGPIQAQLQELKDGLIEADVQRAADREKFIADAQEKDRLQAIADAPLADTRPPVNYGKVNQAMTEMQKQLQGLAKTDPLVRGGMQEIMQEFEKYALDFSYASDSSGFFGGDTANWQTQGFTTQQNTGIDFMDFITEWKKKKLIELGDQGIQIPGLSQGVGLSRVTNVG